MNRLDASRAVILVIDPDPLMLTGIAAVLHTQGYECHCARDAEAARRAANTLPLDLIICEMNMPGRSGVNLCHELIETAALQGVPTIILASEEPKCAMDGPLSKAVVLLRPFQPQLLIDEVANALWMPHLVGTRLRQLQGSKVIPAPAATRRASKADTQRRS
jgi:two-component system OmpR family response regulator